MTLNILLATPLTLYVASDFRLIRVDTKSVLSDHSPKLVSVDEDGWSACITYCGVGSWKKDTNQWLKDWLKHDGSLSPAFEEFAQNVKTRAQRWMQDIRINTRQPTMYHSFMIAAFINKRPRIALISNYDNLYNPKNRTASPLFLLEFMEVSSPVIKVTGQENSVSRADKKALLAEANGPSDEEAVARLMARVIARASASPRSQGTVSSSSYSYCLHSDGRSQGRLHGEVTGEMVPVSLERGSDLMDLIQLRAVPGKQIKAVSMGRFVFRKDVEPSHDECDPESVYPGQGATLTELPTLGGPTSRANAVNSSTIVAGESWLKPGGPAHACIWINDGGAQDLGTLGGSSSIAKDINELGHVVGSSHNNNENHAFLWTIDEGMVDLGTLGGVASHASAINDKGNVVGASWTIPGKGPGDKKEKAFLWNKNEGMVGLGSLSESWSRANDINDLDEVVGISPLGPVTHAFLWTRDRGMIDLGTLGGNSATAVAINNHGQIVGQSERIDGKCVPFIWTRRECMTELPLKQGNQVVSIGEGGMVLYILTTDMGMRAHSSGIEFLVVLRFIG